MTVGRTHESVPPDELTPIDGVICFAVKEEAAFFQPVTFQSVITGMGKANALRGLRFALARFQPELVLTCGFAGGLNPQLRRGTVIFDEDEPAGLSGGLRERGAVAVKFHCADRVLVTAAQKKSLFQSTGADAVEMESAVIRSFCRQSKIPSATIRVVLDTADEDLPLDFGALLTPDDRISRSKLFWKLVRSPGVIPRLIRFHRQTKEAARALGTTLNDLLAARR